MERHGDAIHAIAQPRGGGAVIENVTEMPATAMAMHFGAQREKGTVLACANGIGQRLKETRPAGAAVKLGGGCIKRQITGGAGKGAVAMLVIQRACERTLGAMVAQHIILFARELLAPFGLCLCDFECLVLRCFGFGAIARHEPGSGEDAAKGRSGQKSTSRHHVFLLSLGGSAGLVAACLITPELLEALVATAIPAIEGIAIAVLLVIGLMIVLRCIKGPGGNNPGRDGLVKAS